MKTFNINNISTIYPSFISLIPEILNESGNEELIEKFNNNEFTVSNFFDYIGWGDNIMMVYNTITDNWVYIGFCIINDKYIIYDLNEKTNKEIEPLFFDKLKSINYNILNTTVITDTIELSNIINESHETVFLYKQQYRK